MRCFIFVFFAVLTTTFALRDHGEWINFKQNHDKTYKNSVEENFRFSVFQANLRKIEEHNVQFEQGQSTFKMGMNVFGDLTAEEFLDRLKLSKRNKFPDPVNTENVVHVGDVPDAVDWRKKGAVSEVKNQGTCGSCWAFSTTGAIESAYFIKTGQNISLSEQNLVDCAKDDECLGCNGCWMDIAMEYTELNGIMTEGAYPYKAIDEDCLFNVSESVLKVKNHTFVKTGDEDDLKKAVARQPVSIAIEATTILQFYESGILFDSTCSNDKDSLNHAVLIVGYGTSNDADNEDVDVDYWIVKNSWGRSWGMKGYMMMSRNQDNQCGVATYAVYPVL